MAERESGEGRQNENKLVAVDAGRDKEDGRVAECGDEGESDGNESLAYYLLTHLRNSYCTAAALGQ